MKTADRWPPLLDAGGEEVTVDTCLCGRPKLATSRYCCGHCDSSPSRKHVHATGCNMRCATLGVPGFGVRAGPMPTRVAYLTPHEYERSLGAAKSHG